MLRWFMALNQTKIGLRSFGGFSVTFSKKLDLSNQFVFADQLTRSQRIVKPDRISNESHRQKLYKINPLTQSKSSVKLHTGDSVDYDDGHVPDTFNTNWNESSSGNLLEFNDKTERHHSYSKGKQGGSNQKLPFEDSVIRRVRGEVLFGIHPVLTALVSKKRIIHQLYVKQEHSKFSGNKRISEVVKMAASSGVIVNEVSLSHLNTLSCDRPHQGVCLDVGNFPVAELDTNTLKSDCLRTQGDNLAERLPLWLLLYKVQDPMNMGAILRSALYMGVDRILVLERYSALLSPVVSKASSGAMELLTISQVQNEKLPVLLQVLRESGWSILGTAAPASVDNVSEMTPKVVDVCNYRREAPALFIIGNEGTGMDRELYEFCNSVVTISPTNHQLSVYMDCLNVSTATAIILHRLQT